jgi:uncharacterized protein (DUF924 family)
MEHARAVLDHWFGRMPITAAVLAERQRSWFGAGQAADDIHARDRALEARFGTLVTAALAGELDAWAASPRQCLALILLLDQFPRSIHRGSARAFAGDPSALALALAGMQQAADAALDPVRRMFFYMPLQHSESPAVQEESVAAFSRLLADAPGDLRDGCAAALDSARRHRDVIERFGRFPHRNAALGRENTREEEEFLRAGGEHFGQ